MNYLNLLTPFLLTAAPLLQAATLVQYNMEGFTAGQPIAASSVDSTVTSTNLTKTGMSAATPGQVTYSGADTFSTWFNQVATSSGNFNAGQALTNAQYFSFTLTPQAGQTLSLSSFTLQAAAGTSNATTERAFYLFSSATGFAAGNVMLSDRTAALGGTLALRNTTVANTVATNYNLDISSGSSFGSTFANLTTATTFRLYIQTQATGQSIDFDDISIAGVAVPEPSAATLLAAGAGFCAVVIRRRRTLL